MAVASLELYDLHGQPTWSLILLVVLSLHTRSIEHCPARLTPPELAAKGVSLLSRNQRDLSVRGSGTHRSDKSASARPQPSFLLYAKATVTRREKYGRVRLHGAMLRTGKLGLSEGKKRRRMPHKMG